MAARIYLFSYNASITERREICIDERLLKLHDIKHIHNAVFLIKTDDDISILTKYLASCFDEKDSYFLVNITDQPNRYINTQSADIARWMDNI
ncbi:hypothetical protein [Shouchella shacheensis]|uniref:hypothetical protein n=1 Tax=Shouchella shacheensis TaxID=1649580 RepID=UPI0007401F25|nr:hypothetical protein [Shouchella shacheensis]